MQAYTVKQVSELAGVSIRTLHHYDQIGVLVPKARTEAGYRLYAEEDLIRLQHILFSPNWIFRYVPSNPCSTITGSIWSRVKALEQYQNLLKTKAECIVQLLLTIDSTIRRLKGE